MSTNCRALTAPPISVVRARRRSRKDPSIAKGRQQLLRMVLNNMSQGVLMFAPDTRLVFCNRRYCEMYGLSPGSITPGMTIRDLLQRRAAAHTFAGDPEEYVVDLLKKVARGKTTVTTTQLADGRVMSIINKPMADGGWLATHEDITERQRAEAQIAHMARHDALTDLPNRILLRERIEHELKRVKRGECLAVLCLDSITSRASTIRLAIPSATSS